MLKVLSSTLCIIGLLMALCGTALCQSAASDDMAERKAEQREAFGLATKLQVPDQTVTAPEPAAAVSQPISKPAPKPERKSTPKVQTDNTSKDNPAVPAAKSSPTVPAVTVREVTREAGPAARPKAETARTDVPTAGAPVIGAESVDADGELKLGDTPESKPHVDKIAMLLDEGTGKEPSRESKGSPLGAVFDTIWKLGVVCGLAYVALLALKWLYNRREVMPHGSKHLKIVDTIKLSPNSSLHLINAHGKTLLVGSSAEHVNILGEIEMSETVEAPEPAENRFAEHLEKYFTSAPNASPAVRIGGMLRDCTDYLKKRRHAAMHTVRAGVGDIDES